MTQSYSPQPDQNILAGDPEPGSMQAVPPSGAVRVWQCRDKQIPLSPEPVIMGVVNVTPDSFSDGGRYLDPSRAINQALQMLHEGAHIIDIGGESSRPGAASVAADEQIRRVLPVIEGILTKKPDAIISIDTTSSIVAQNAIKAGVSIINDISGLTQDTNMSALARETHAGVVIMHMQGTPENMQNDPNYKNCVADILEWLQARVTALTAAGIDPDCIAIDPGIGFGKKLAHNLEILHGLAHFTSIGAPILVGASRKRFIGMVGNVESPSDRLPGSLAALTCAVLQGASILRVHDVPESLQAARIATAIREPARWKHL